MINNENENNSMAQEPQTPQQTVDAQPGGYTAGERAHLDIEIITPDRVFYKGETDFLEFNTQNGEIGVYKNHRPRTGRKGAGRAAPFKSHSRD